MYLKIDREEVNMWLSEAESLMLRLVIVKFLPSLSAGK